ncbi:MAG: PqqD family protein [Bacteroidales bacterium]|nr:PqqD family protein [Bacteroidales bacterium]
MKIKEGFTLRTICGNHIVVGEGLALVNFDKMLSLNESAAYLWEQVNGRDFTEDDLTNLLTDKYEVSEEKAREDVRKMIIIWQENGMLE